MDHDEAYRGLKKRAIEFHSILQEHNIYTEPTGEDEFLERVNPQIERAAETLASE